MGRPSKTPTPRDLKIAELYATGDYLTVSETANLLNVSASLVRRQTKGWRVSVWVDGENKTTPLIPKSWHTRRLSERLESVESLRKELTAIKRSIPKKRKAVERG